MFQLPPLEEIENALDQNWRERERLKALRKIAHKEAEQERLQTAARRAPRVSDHQTKLEAAPC